MTPSSTGRSNNGLWIPGFWNRVLQGIVIIGVASGGTGFLLAIGNFHQQKSIVQDHIAMKIKVDKLWEDAIRAEAMKDEFVARRARLDRLELKLNTLLADAGFNPETLRKERRQ